MTPQEQARQKLREYLVYLLPAKGDRTIFDSEVNAVVDLCRPLVEDEWIDVFEEDFITRYKEKHNINQPPKQ